MLNGHKPTASGSFTNVYNHPSEPDKVILVSSCPVKDIINLGWMPSSIECGYDVELYPTCTPYDGDGVPDEMRAYVMTKYEQPRALKKAIPASDWRVFRQLKQFSNRIHYRNGVVTELSYLYLLKLIDSDENLDDWLKVFLKESIDALMNFGGDMVFEISNRNVAVHNGRLILLDVWFFFSKLKRY